MNVSAKTKKSNIPWRRIIPVAVVLIILGYNFARPTLQKWTGLDLPALNENRNNNNRFPSAENNRSTSDQDYSVTFSGGSFQLKEVGRDRYESPAGLLYTMGPRGEHRIEHVMRHSRNIEDRHAHGVFIGDGNRDTVLQLIDDAWELAKAKSPKARREDSDGKDAWTVNMGRKVGSDGGRKGKKNGGKSLNSIKLILRDGNQVVTAYPVR